MAEVQKEIQDRIFRCDKDNGQSIQLNIVKWGRNSSKYDLRVWEGDKPYKGMTLSDQEVKRLAAEFVRYFGKPSLNNSQGVVFESNPKTPVHMEQVDLKRIISKYPSILNDYNRLAAIMRDMYPKYRLETTLLLNLFMTGAVAKIQKKKVLHDVDLKMYIGSMEREYGIMSQYTVAAVTHWAKALGTTCEFKMTDKQRDPSTPDLGIPSAGRQVPVTDRTSDAIGADKILFENSDLSIVYKGVYKFDGLFAQGHRIRFIIENKTNHKMSISGKSISANGFVVTSSDLFNSDVEPHKKLIDTVLMNGSNLKTAGIKSVQDMSELAIMFEYDGLSGKKRTPELKMVPFEIEG